MAETTSFQLLEDKITRAIDKIADLKSENSELQKRMKVLEKEKAALMKTVARMGKQPVSKGSDLDVNKLRNKVDSLLGKLDELNL
ncbi:MAG: cell division protein ZapB [Candidatus Krumholzibacteria bacterium]|nr:cell division protein ZapB [Candidatus Krumholzibacteria bacterium]